MDTTSVAAAAFKAGYDLGRAAGRAGLAASRDEVEVLRPTTEFRYNGSDTLRRVVLSNLAIGRDELLLVGGWQVALDGVPCDPAYRTFFAHQILNPQAGAPVSFASVSLYPAGISA
jgi:hypothetical protein